MNYNDMTTEELLLLNSIDVSKDDYVYGYVHMYYNYIILQVILEENVIVTM